MLFDSGSDLTDSPFVTDKLVRVEHCGFFVVAFNADCKAA